MSADLRTTYMGMKLANPLVAAASPLSGTIEGMMALEEAGAAAIVMQSLFEEQIEHHELSVNSILETGVDSFPEARNFFPGLDDYNTGPESYLQLIELAKDRLRVPVIASLNGISRGGWTRYARLIEEAGADALELNIYFVAADPRVSGRRRGALRRSGRRGRGVDLDPACGQGRPVLLVAGQRGVAAGGGRRERPGAVQPVPVSRHLADPDAGGADAQPQLLG